jgi:hypothetical protein
VKKILVIAVLAALAYGGYAFVLRPPAKRTCLRAAELCGLDPAGKQAEQCVQMFDSIKKSDPASVERVTTCISEAKTCGEAAGCASGMALTLGTGFVQDFLKGIQKSTR